MRIKKFKIFNESVKDDILEIIEICEPDEETISTLDEWGSSIDDYKGFVHIHIDKVVDFFNNRNIGITEDNINIDTNSFDELIMSINLEDFISMPLFTTADKIKSIKNITKLFLKHEFVDSSEFNKDIEEIQINFGNTMDI
jgi:hypothetical protein